MAAAPPADDDEAPAIGYMSSTMSTGEISYCYDPSSPNEIFVHQDGP